MGGAITHDQVGFGETLRRFRVAAGLTQEALAERAGLSARGISDLERAARTRPYPTTVHRLAGALDLSAAEQAILEAAADTTPARETGRLPTPLSSLIGREQDVAQVRHLLARHRLLTLLGAGGIGKTRLAIEAARGLSEAFADGVVFVGLASVAEPSMVLGAVAEALGIRETSGGGLLERVQHRLRSAELLLVLDNFEHVLPAAAWLGSLLERCPRLKVLVTSRAALRISGEHECPVRPLAAPSAVQLFVERGASVGCDVADQQLAIDEICARLDGLPLAIELAAARLRVLSTEQLLDRLVRALPVLVGGTRDMPARQRTLTATIAWSYNLLRESEQRLFRRLAVFVGGFTLEAAEAVCDAPDLGVPVLDGLDSLAAQSLIGRDTEQAGRTRFVVLETVREYALEQARATGELDLLRHKHAGYFRTFAEQAAPEFASAHAPEWLRRTDAEHANLRAALTLALEEGDADTASRVSAAIWPYWYARGHLTEGSQWLDRSLRIARDVTQARVRALTGAGVLAHYQGFYSRATMLCGESLALCRSRGDRMGVANALHGLALVARSRGDFSSARTMYEEARSIHEAVGDEWGLSYTLRYLAVVLWMEADHAAARPVIERSLALASRIGDSQGVGITLTVRSFVARSLGECALAETAARESLAVHEAYGDRRGGAQALWALGMAVAGMGRFAEANTHHKRALSIFHEVGDRYFTGVCCIGLAQVALAAGCAPEAVQLVAADSAMTANIGAPRWPSIQPYIQQTLAAASQMLDVDGFDRAWALGSALSIEEAVELGMHVSC